MVQTQIIFIDVYNDFSLSKIRILMNGYSPFPEWLLILIILGSIIGGVILLGGIFIGIKKIKQNYINNNYNDDGEDNYNNS